MRPIQPPQLKLRRARKGRRAIWVIKDREREISTGAGEGERGKAEIAFAEYLVKNHQPFFGDGRPNQVLIGDCLAIYCDKHGPKIARPDGLALEVERLAEFFGDGWSPMSRRNCAHGYVEWRCTQTDKRATRKQGPTDQAVSTAKRELVTLSAALNWCWRNKRLDRPVVVILPKIAERRERYLTRTRCRSIPMGGARIQSRRHAQQVSHQPAPRPIHL